MEYIDIKQLVKLRNNPRTIKDESFKKLCDSIKSNSDFFEARPLLISNRTGENVIIGGNQRYEAAKSLGLNKVPCHIFDNLTEDKEREIIIRDNVNNGEWDFELLANEWNVEDLIQWDVDLPVDFSLQQDDEIQLGEELNEIPAEPINPITKLGDVWLLGNHRLMCGDSTMLNDIEKLMNGNKADMVFTDPPYNVGFAGRSGNFDIIKNDNLTEEQFNIFIKEICQNINVLNPKCYYIWCNWKFYGILQENLKFTSCIVWVKNNFGLGANYRHQHEFCLFDGDIDKNIKNESDVWEIERDTNYIHPTQKPIDLAVRALNNHMLYDNILDLFGGSGSTLIACEKTNRINYSMELDPKYCDVIIQRWQNYTKKDAILESTRIKYNDYQ